MNKLVALALLCCLSAALASDCTETGRPVIQLASIGGYVPNDVIANQIPEVKIWEDGTIIVSTYASGKRQILFNSIKRDEIAHLTDKIQASDFMQFADHYTGENAPTDGPSTCIKFWKSETEHKQVCDYFNGAPEFFSYLTTHLRALKDLAKATARPFYPCQPGFVKAYPQESQNGKDVLSYSGPKITATGVWITDLQTLAKLWDAANNNQLVTDCPNHFFRVSVQIDDLSVVNPPPRIDLPRANPGTPATLIVRYVAIGVSGFMFILGVVLLVRIIRRRKQLKDAERAEEVQLVESPTHSSSVYEQQTPFVATQQWAGTPSFVNTTPQYMVYYMQPTQTTQ